MLNDLIGKYVIVRTSLPEVYAGMLIKRDGHEVLIKDARRIKKGYVAREWGLTCEFPYALLSEVVEILVVSEEGEQLIRDLEPCDFYIRGG